MTTMPAAIRFARFPSDAPVLQALIADYIAWLDCDLSYQDVDAELANLATVYAEPRGFMLVAFDGADMVGCVGMKRLDAATGEVKRLYVKPSFQGRRCGRDLVEALIAQAASTGVQRLLLDAAPKTIKAQHLYLALGFREIAAYYDSPLVGTRYFELRGLFDRRDQFSA